MLDIIHMGYHHAEGLPKSHRGLLLSLNQGQHHREAFPRGQGTLLWLSIAA